MCCSSGAFLKGVYGYPSGYTGYGHRIGYAGYGAGRLGYGGYRVVHGGFHGGYARGGYGGRRCR
jgi:hypothetical protein